ncbi:MAG: hypothetical protein K6E53_09360 [Lachnospiraceae bacterium]|nr:hypothetical protein [Lachnospiraceae bacterium]
MKKKSLIAFLIGLMCALLLAGCGGTSISVDTEIHGNGREPSGKTDEDEYEKEPVNESVPEKTDETSEMDKPDDETTADQDGEPEENAYDGGPDWVTMADQFTLPTSRMCIEDAVTKYAITLVDDGKYHDYEGDIGDVIQEYKDRDLDGDRKPDVIKREGQHYVFELTRRGTFKTDDYSASPNEGEVIQFEDLGCRNLDEIEIVHYTFGTGGPSVSDTAVYSWQDGEWRAYPVIDRDGVINSNSLCELISKETGKPYEAGSIRVADVSMQTLLLDFGKKDGPSQTYDYKTAYLRMNFFPGHLVEGDYDCSGLEADISLIRGWPYELAGEPIPLGGELLHDLNVFMSNFSEQGYEKETWPVSYAHFALEWCRINDPSSVNYRNNRHGIDAGTLSKVVDRYFGSFFDEGDFYDMGIDNPYLGTVEDIDGTLWYFEPEADGEMYRNNAFTVVTDAQKIRGKYDTFLRLPFKVYAVNTDEYDRNGISKEYYSLSMDEAEELVSKGELLYKGEGLAYLEEVGTDRTKSGYWLTTYLPRF